MFRRKFLGIQVSHRNTIQNHVKNGRTMEALTDREPSTSSINRRKVGQYWSLAWTSPCKLLKSLTQEKEHQMGA
jgi:hypothetical protein